MMMEKFEARKISKRFPGVQALTEVSLTIHAREILAVVGENGAGKSTLMKILSGIERPDEGKLEWNGKEVTFKSVSEAEKQGIVLVHQELSLAENLDIAANLFLGREPTFAGPLKLLASTHAVSRDILKRVGLEVSTRTRVGELSLGQQQLVEIARALSRNSQVLILDEPTSSLTERESQKLIEVLYDLKSQGVAIIYISHRLQEVVRLADRATVLRDGKNAGELNSKEELTTQNLVRLMVGRDLKQLHQRQFTVTDSMNSTRSPLLQVKGLRWTKQQSSSGASLTLQPGEILGLAGLVGAGRTELAETLFGIRSTLSGVIELNGQVYRAISPAKAIASGLFLVPEDRRLQGLMLMDSIRSNISLASLERLQKWRIVSGRKDKQLATDMVSKLGIRTSGIRKAVGLLSGGNQQKVVLAKSLARTPRLLILDEPTRGVDVGAKAEIYRIMDEIAGQGVGILMISSDLEEILGVSDRIIVMREGSTVGELKKPEFSEQAVMKLATGT